MASVDRRAENRINATLLPNPGPYLARIVSNVDPMKQGALEVELLRPIGNQKEVGRQLFVVRYLSPFYGVTPLDVTGTGAPEFNDTQKSYGFWAVPPDVGVTVMVIFVDSDPGQGYWIGCVQDALMNYMIPGIASSSNFQDKVRGSTDIQWEEIEDTKKRYGEEIEYLPVGEVNRKIFQAGGNNAATPNPDVEANKKPVHPLAERLLIQGLEKDNARGHTTSSARRESPSNVYGWSTPGPIDKRKGAKLGKIGKVNDKIDKFVSRMGGHCIIMDDGNDRFLRKTRPWEGPPEYADLEAGEEGLVDFPLDEQIRIRTRKGAQILLHSTEDLIYITNSRGTAWMEFTSEGKILMYAKDGIHQTSGGDISVTARRDMHYDVGRNHNKKVAANDTTNVGGSHTAMVDGSHYVVAQGDVSQDAGNHMYQKAAFNHETTAQQVAMTSSTHEWNVGGNLLINCSGSNFEVLAANVALTGSNEVHLHADKDMRMSGREVDIRAAAGDLTMYAAVVAYVKSDGNIHMESAGSSTVNAAGGQINLTSKDTTSVTGGTGIRMQGASGKISIAGKIYQKAGEIHLNGDDPPTPIAADSGLPIANEALPASAATGASGTATAGGGLEFPVTLASYPNGVGGGLDKIAPTAQPYDLAENKSPARVHQAVTDHMNPTLMAANGQTYNVHFSKQIEDVPYEAGGLEDGTLARSGWNFGSGHLPNLGKSKTSRPLNKDYLIGYPLDWTKDKEFLSKAQQVAGQFGVKKEEFLAVLAIETLKTMDPSFKHPTGSRVGLAQMSEKHANQAGTTNAKLRHMSRAEQLDYVQKHLQKSASGGIKDAGRLYLALAFPKKASTRDGEEVFKRGSKAWHNLPNLRQGSPAGKITPESITAAIKKEAEWVSAALGSGQNNSAQQANQGPSYSPSGTNPRVASAPTSLPYPTQNLANNGTNVQYPGKNTV